MLRGPLYEDDIGTRFAGLAAHYRDFGPNRRIFPFDLVGQFVSDGGRVGAPLWKFAWKSSWSLKRMQHGG